MSALFNRSVLAIICLATLISWVGSQASDNKSVLPLSPTYALRQFKDAHGAIQRCEILPRRLVESGEDRFDLDKDEANALSADEFQTVLSQAFGYCSVGELRRKAKGGLGNAYKLTFVDEYEGGFVEIEILTNDGEYRILSAKILPLRLISGEVTAGPPCSSDETCWIEINDKVYLLPRNHGKIKKRGIVKLRAAGPKYE